MGGGRHRARACDKVADVYLLVETLARRLSVMSFQDGPAPHVEEEDEELPERAANRGALSLSMADVLCPETDDEEAAAATAEGVSVNEFRLRYFRVFLDYMTQGCKSPEEVMVKLLAFIRRVRPESLADLGLSQAEVGRKLGVSRQTVHAREKKVETLLERNGARGIHGLGGQRSATHRERCRVAQIGNTNRRDGTRRKRAG